MDADLGFLALRTGIAFAVSVLVVMLVRRPIRRWLGAKTAYQLWLIVPLMMAASLLPQPINVPLVTLQAEPPPPSPSGLPTSDSAPYNWVVLLWGVGVFVAVLVIAARQIEFMRTLGKSSLDGDGLPILRARDGFAVGPAVVGFLSPRIVLPADFEDRYSADEQRLILAHERAHLFGHDPQANVVAALLQCLNWFNPLAHIAARMFRIDQELAADASVVAQFPKHEKAYAEVLLKTQIASHSLPLGCQWPARSQHPLRERVAMLRSPPTRTRFGALILAVLAIGASTAAWAASPRFALSDPGAPRVILWTVLKTNGAAPADPQPTTVTSGSWTKLSFTLADGSVYNFRLKPTVLAGGQVQVVALVEDNGAMAEAPSLLLTGSEPGVVRMKSATLFVTAGKPPW